MKRNLTIVTIAAAVLVLVLLLGWPRDGEETATDAPLSRKVLLIGVDGMEWDVMGPLVEAGRLPNLTRLLHEGCWGEIRSLDVLESPVIWTSIGTGKLPEKHGISGFAKPGRAGGELVPTTSNVRRVKAIWNILSEAGMTVGIVGWLATWPAEAVNGYMVTSYFEYGRAPVQRDEPERVTYPAELLHELSPLKLDEEDVEDARAAALIDGEVPSEGALRVRFESIKRCIASDETFRRAGLHLLREKPVDFFSVYMRAVDGPCHQFWVDAFPDAGPDVTPEEVGVFGEVVSRYYEYVDGIVGEFIDQADRNSTVIVTSDHGHSGPKPHGDSFAWGIAMHDATGVVVFWGKDIVRGHELADVSVLDITPTILALYGLPVADDMDGRVLTEAIDPSFLEAYPVTSIASYEDPEGRAVAEAEPIESTVDDEVRERLRSLGYID